MPMPEPVLDLRLTGLGRDLRSRGASSSASRALRLAGGFFGVSSSSSSSPTVTRSSGLRRSSASDAAGPNRGSLRPPPFFRPHGIRSNARAPDARDYRVGVQA